MFVFQKDDYKYRAWSGALRDQGIETAAVTGSPIQAPLVLLRMRMRGVAIEGYVFRYLNDYHSLIKTIIRAISELLVIALVKAVGGRLIWIAHNVDKESECHHQRLSSLRRRFVNSAAHVTFVMDPLLKTEMKLVSRAIEWTCFGKPLELPLNAETSMIRQAMIDLRQRLQKAHAGSRIYVGLCVSAPSPKCVHFLTVCRFVERFSTDGVVVGVVVVGAVGTIKEERFERARKRMHLHEQVTLIDESITVRERYLKDHMDFFYRSLDDSSVSYSIYVAASTRRPMIVESGTFLAKMISTYELGATIPPGQERGGENWLKQRLDRWDPTHADRFLSVRNWTIAANQLATAMVGNGQAGSP